MRLISLIAAFLCIASCANAQETSPKLNVVASFSILGDMVHEIAGDNVNLTVLVGANSDAHAYEPTPADAKALANANLVIVNGMGFEGWMDRLVQSSGYGGTVAVASDNIAPIDIDGTPDPHAWQDLNNGKIYAINISYALTKADPAHAKLYSTGAAAYIAKIKALSAWAVAEMDAIPPKQRRAVLSHDAMRYFSTAYNISFISPLGSNTAGSVAADYMAQLVDLLRRKEVRVVFTENMSDPRIAQQLVADGGAVMGGMLYSDALSLPAGPAGSYLSMFKYNVSIMKQALIAN